MENKLIVVWFSCGAASAIAAKKTIEKYGGKNKIIIANIPVHEEHEDNKRFLKDVSKWLNYPILKVTNKDFPNCSIIEVFDKRKYMSGNKGAPCTMVLKKEARYQLECKIEIDWHVFGFTYEETERHNNFIKRERSNVLPVLIDEKISKNDCFKLLTIAGIELPYIYKLGYPNANCIGCVKASSPEYWNLVRKTFPEVFEQRAIQSREIGCKLVRVKGKRIYLDELNPTDRGRKIKSWECDLFCK